MFKSSLFTAALLCSAALPLHAQDATPQEAFVEANILSIFYHELGHAVIDLMEVPIFGQEEDAADVMSVLLVDWLFDEETAQSLAYDSAFGFINDPSQTEEVAYWDLHGPDEQRFYNHICLFYGANPDEREDLANDLELPEDRAEYCPDEYDQAANSWGAIFDEMDAQTSDEKMVFAAGTGPGAEVINRVLGDEIDSMNSDLKLPMEITVSVESCGEANAYYDPNEISITFCTEFVDHLADIHTQLFD
jgi:hypothetical protein